MATEFDKRTVTPPIWMQHDVRLRQSRDKTHHESNDASKTHQNTRDGGSTPSTCSTPFYTALITAICQACVCCRQQHVPSTHVAHIEISKTHLYSVHSVITTLAGTERNDISTLHALSVTCSSRNAVRQNANNEQMKIWNKWPVKNGHRTRSPTANKRNVYLPKTKLQ